MSTPRKYSTAKAFRVALEARLKQIADSEQIDLQRLRRLVAFDRLLATRFGTMAVHLIAEGKLGYMVALQNERIVSVPITKAVAKQRLVPLDSDIILTALGLDVCLGVRAASLDVSPEFQEGCDA